MTEEKIFAVRCAFNGFCRKVLRYECINAYRDMERQRRREVTFSDLTPKQENQLYSVDRYFVDENGHGSFQVAGRLVSPGLLAAALHTLPEDKRNILLLYYFHGMSDPEIAQLYGIPRSTVQYRWTSSFPLLRRYLEERTHEYDEWEG